MLVKKLNECGYDEAIFGLGLNKKLTSSFKNCDDVPDETYNRLIDIAGKLSKMSGGHDNFLENIYTWWKVNMPLYFWRQMDRYRVGKSQQSSSTMHTILKETLTQNDFCYPIPVSMLDELNSAIKKGNIGIISNLLPNGYMQTRQLSINYKCIKNIINQRKGHKLYEWSFFCEEILKQVEHPELFN